MISQADVERIARAAAQEAAEEAAEKAVQKCAPQAISAALIACGFDVSDPTRMQRNNAFLDATRARCEKAGSQAQVVLIALIVGGVAAAVWQGIVRGAIELMPK